MDNFPDEIILLLIRRALLLQPIPATVCDLAAVNKQWRELVLQNTLPGSHEQPYDVVCGVLFAWILEDDDTAPAISIKPPREARLRVIPDDAFPSSFQRIESVDLSECDKLSSVGERAFQSFEITTLSLPGNARNLVSIGDDAFAFARLTTLDLTSCIALETIGQWAFYNSSLTTLDVSRCAALKTIHQGAFYLSIMTTLNLSNCTALRYIEGKAFYWSMLTKLDLSDCTALVEIGDEAFFSSLLTTLNLSGCAALERLGREAFTNSPLSRLDFSVPERTLQLEVGWFCFWSSSISRLYPHSHFLAPGRYTE